MTESSAERWSVARVGEWLDANDLSPHKPTFEEHEITGQVLCGLDHELLKEMGITVVGHRLAILHAIELLLASEAGLTDDQLKRIAASALSERRRTGAGRLTTSASEGNLLVRSESGVSDSDPETPPTATVPAPRRPPRARTSMSQSRDSSRESSPSRAAPAPASAVSPAVQRRLSARRDSSPPKLGSGIIGTPIITDIDFQGDADMKGWMHKKKSGMSLKSWDKRFFVLKNGVLYYAKTDTATKPIGLIDLDNRVVLRGQGKAKNELKLCHTSGHEREYVLRADSTPEVIAWMNALVNHSSCRSKGESTEAANDVQSADEIMPPAVVRMISQGKIPSDVGAFIRQGVLKKSPGKGRGAHKMRQFFLFSHALVYAVPSTWKKDYKVKGVIDLSGVSMCDLPDDRNTGELYQFCIICDQGRYILGCDSVDDKYLWMADLFQAIEALLPPDPTLLDDADANTADMAARGVELASIAAATNSDSPLATSAAAAATTTTAPASPASASAPDRPARKGTLASRMAEMDAAPDAAPDARSRLMSIRSMVTLDKTFPKPPMPNCVRVGTYNVIFPDKEKSSSTMASVWSERRNLFATAIRFHSPDVLGVQNLSARRARDLLSKMSDYECVDGCSEHREDGAPDGRPFLPILFFKWRLQLADSSNFYLALSDDEGDAAKRTTGDIGPWDPLPKPKGRVWVTWARFLDVFTDNQFIVFNLDITLHCANPESRQRITQELCAAIGRRVGSLPFLVLISGYLAVDGSPPYDGLSEPFTIPANSDVYASPEELADADPDSPIQPIPSPGDTTTRLLDATLEDVPPGHVHVGPRTTFAAPDGTAATLDFVFGRELMVEILQSGVTRDSFVSGARAAYHDMLIADIIVDMDP